MKQYETLEDVLTRRPISDDDRRQAQSALEAELTAHMLRELRKAHRLSQAQLAERMGVSQRRVSAIERGAINRNEVATLRAYVEALGGRIHLVAEFDGKQTLIA